MAITDVNGDGKHDLVTANNGSNNGSVLLGGVPAKNAPTATNLSAPETYTEDTPLNLTDIVVSDVDGDPITVTLTLTLSNTAAGSLNSATSNAVTSTYVPGTGVWTASGAIADVNVLLAGLKFTPTNGFVGTGHFTVQASTSGIDAGLGGNTVTADITVNGMTLGDTVWIDSNANSTYEIGVDFVLSNIALTLFQGDGTTVVNTTTTDNLGRYQFTDLPPGDYVVRVDAANFGVSAPLKGLLSIGTTNIGRR